MRKERLRILVTASAIVAWALAPANGWAIDRDLSLLQLHHVSWTAREGAPTDVQSMAQTEDGFMWFATSNGLVRFDGVQFDRYLPSSGQALPSGSIRALLALPGNALMIGWVFGGATLLRDGGVTDFGAKDGFPTGSPYQFLVDGDGKLWAATADALARFDGTRWHVIGSDWNFGGQRAMSLFLDRDGTLGAFTPNSLMILPRGGTTFQPADGKPNAWVRIVRSHEGTLYISDARGIRSIASLVRYADMERPVYAGTKPDDADARHMIADRDGSLWFQSRRGVGRIAYPERPDATAEYFAKSDGLSDAQASRLFEDRQGNIWVATPSGVDRFRAGSFVAPAGALGVSFAVMAPDSNGGLFLAGFGVAGKHLAVDGTVRALEPFLATCAYRDPDGVVWFGSQRATPRIAEMWRYQGSRLHPVDLPDDLPPNAVVQSIAMDASRSLWISARRAGVYRLSAGAWSKPTELPDAGKRTAIVMTADSGGRVWLGYAGSRVALWDGAKIRTFTAADGLEIGNVLAIHEKGPHLWVAGERGLAIFESDRFRALWTDDREALQGIKGLVETDEGDLWLHRSAGVVLIRAEQVQRALLEPTHAMAYRLFDYDDGLFGVPTDIGPLPTLVAGTDGRLWFATNRGVFLRDPRRAATNKIPPTVVVKAVLAGGVRHPPGESIDLPALTTSVQVDYTATSMAVPARMRFRHKLGGVDADWQDAGSRRQAFYTNLGPGNYRFQVAARNEDGVWNSSGAAFAFTIAPAWYQTKGFLALCGLAVTAALALLYRYRVGRIRAQVQGRLQERLLERERIARELHDTLLQGFQGLVITFGAALRRLAPGEARITMEKALARAQDMLAEGRDRVKGLRDSVGFHGDLRTALEDAAGDLVLGQAIEFNLVEQGDRRALHPLVMEEAFLIAREALANAYHHSAGKRVDAEIQYGTSQFRLRIRDDGKGIDGEVMEHGVAGHWGMSGMRERAQHLGGRLLVRSGAGAGTEVELEIPATVAYRPAAARERLAPAGRPRETETPDA